MDLLPGQPEERELLGDPPLVDLVVDGLAGRVVSALERLEGSIQAGVEGPGRDLPAGDPTRRAP